MRKIDFIARWSIFLVYEKGKAAKNLSPGQTGKSQVMGENIIINRRDGESLALSRLCCRHWLNCTEKNTKMKGRSACLWQLAINSCQVKRQNGCTLLLKTKRATTLPHITAIFKIDKSKLIYLSTYCVTLVSIHKINYQNILH